jgi:hypothetical protein
VQSAVRVTPAPELFTLPYVTQTPHCDCTANVRRTRHHHLPLRLLVHLASKMLDRVVTSHQTSLEHPTDPPHPPGEGRGKPIGTTYRHTLLSRSHSLMSLLQLEAARCPLADRLVTNDSWRPSTPWQLQSDASQSCKAPSAAANTTSSLPVDASSGR